jgi:hypothetical protein
VRVECPICGPHPTASCDQRVLGEADDGDMDNKKTVEQQHRGGHLEPNCAGWPARAFPRPRDFLGFLLVTREVRGPCGWWPYARNISTWPPRRTGPPEKRERLAAIRVRHTEIR